MGAAQKKTTTQSVLLDNPLDGEQLFLDAMFGDVPQAPSKVVTESTEPSQKTSPETLKSEPLKKSKRSERRAEKPSHYKVVSISLYLEDIDRLDGLVKELKKRGHYKANKSQLIRAALMQVDLDQVSRDL